MPQASKQKHCKLFFYYFPNWGPVDLSEWALFKKAKPKFEGQKQPKLPVWGYQNENDPEAMAQKIDAATILWDKRCSHNVDTIWSVEVDRRDFDIVTDRIISRYMKHPSNYKIDGKLVNMNMDWILILY